MICTFEVATEWPHLRLSVTFSPRLGAIQRMLLEATVEKLDCRGEGIIPRQRVHDFKKVLVNDIHFSSHMNIYAGLSGFMIIC